MKVLTNTKRIELISSILSNHSGTNLELSNKEMLYKYLETEQYIL